MQLQSRSRHPPGSNEVPGEEILPQDLVDWSTRSRGADVLMPDFSILGPCSNRRSIQIYCILWILTFDY